MLRWQRVSAQGVGMVLAFLVVQVHSQVMASLAGQLRAAGMKNAHGGCAELARAAPRAAMVSADLVLPVWASAVHWV